MLALDPMRLARRQLELDRERTGRFPHLLAHKASRMSASPLALLRGSAPLFYEVLERHPVLTEGPSGEGWLVGDCHLENFGVFRTGALHTPETKDDRHDPVVFDLNDFDDAFVGPFRYDVLRLTTSLILGGRELGTDARTTLDLAAALLEAYTAAAFEPETDSKSAPEDIKRAPEKGKKAPGKGARAKAPRRAPPPAAVAALLEKVRSRTRKALLDGRTEIVKGVRRLVRGPRYEDIPAKLRVRAERAFGKYVERLPARGRPPEEALEVLDVAFRVAGTGSLGSLRLALLVRGKGGPDGAWMFDMKEEGEPSASNLVRPPRLPPGERVVAAIEASVADPPRMIGATKLRGSSMFVRRLSPQEDKLDLTKLSPADMAPLARYLGTVLGAAHRRGMKRAPKKAWRPSDRAQLLERAIALAGMHEAMYLAYSEMLRR